MRIASPDPSASSSMERVLYSLADGLVWIDTTDHVAFWNPRAEALLRWPAVEMVGRRVQEMLDRVIIYITTPDKTRAEFENALSDSDVEHTIEFELLPNPPSAGSRDRTPAAMEENVDMPDRLLERTDTATSEGGHSLDHAMPSNGRHIAARFFPVRGADGTSMGVGMLVRDITREKQADAMKTQLLSTVSHELRTPLASIKGFATTLLRQDVKWDETTQRDFLRIIEEESDRLSEIIDNLLDMSQIEAGALRIDKTPTQLRTLIREVVDEMRMRTEAHWFVMDLPSDLPLALVDPRRIRQVLHNLIENAIKYSKDGQITISCEVEGDHMVVSVSDQGEGIPAEYINQVFERFFQIDGQSTRRVGGSGLGLSISRGIVEAHGGKIWAESSPSTDARSTVHGSTFHFTIPLAPVEGDE